MSTVVSASEECEIRAYAKGAARFCLGKSGGMGTDLVNHLLSFNCACSIEGFCIPYLLLTMHVKKQYPRAFRYALVIPIITALHTLTYIPKDLDKCRAHGEEMKRQRLF